MIDLTVTGHAEPEQDRAEIARLLKEYGTGAVCLLRNGNFFDLETVCPDFLDLGPCFELCHSRYGTYSTNRDFDIIRVFPPSTRLRVTVQVVE
jgi:hypothetical protein